MFKKILIPTDGPGLEDHMFRYAALNFPFAHFYIISVVQSEPRAVQLLNLLRPLLKENADKAIAHAEKILGNEGIEIKKKKVLYGITSNEIIKYAKLEGIDLILMRSQCKTGTFHRRFVATINNIIKRTQCPVLIITSFPGHQKPEKIIFPINESFFDQTVMENIAMNAAKTLNTELTALYIIDKVKGNREKIHAEKILNKMAQKARHFDLKLKKIIDCGNTANTLLKYAASYDMIIMGAYKKGIFHRAIMNRGARQICVRSPVPILFIGRHQK